MTLAVTVNKLPAKSVDISNGFSIRSLGVDEVPQIVVLTRQRIGEATASAEVMRRVINRNEDSFWGVFDDGAKGALAGYYSFLFLCGDGHRALLNKELDTIQPPVNAIVRTGEPASAIYLWGVVAKGMIGSSAPIVIQMLSQRYSGLPLYTTMATTDGLRRGRTFGFKPVSASDDRIGGLFAFGGYTQLPRAEQAITIKVVSTADQLQQAQTIRAATFMSEQLCPYKEEYDGNDYSAQHIVGYVDGEPAATIRIRYFAQFAKLERYAVLKRFRKTAVKDEIIEFAISVVQRKGYRKVYGQAQARLRTFWKARGFRIADRNIDIRYSDHDYIEVEKILTSCPDALTTAADPMVLNRHEGNWDKEGILEASSHRPATRPC